MNKKAVLPLTAGVTLLVAGTLWVRGRGGIANALNQPPTITIVKAFPAFTLSEITQDSWGDYLVVKSPFVDRISPRRNIHSLEFVSPKDALTATAIDSNGQRWNLRWDVRPGASYSADDKYGPDALIYIWRPDSCPPDVKWYDVTLKSKWGGSAIWRATNLQVARHFGQNAPGRPSITFNGMTVSCMADRFFAVNGSPQSFTLRSFFTAKGKPSDGKDWRVCIKSSTREWENPARVSEFSTVWQKSEPTSFGNSIGPCQYWTEQYPQRNHYIYATGSFALFENEQIQRTIPFSLKIPIIFKTYSRKGLEVHPKK